MNQTSRVERLPGAGFQDPGRSASAPPDLIRRFGGYVVMFFIFMMYTRLPEVFPVRTHLPLFAGVLLLLFTVFTDGIPRVFSSKPAWLLGGYTFWFILTIPFSNYRRGSVELFTGQHSVAFMCFLGAVALTYTRSQLRQLTWVIAAGCTFISFLAIFYGVESLGRLEISREVSGSLDNANDLALHLLFGVPFCVLIAADPTRAKTMRALGGAAALVSLYATLLTGSRMGLLGLAVLIAMIFLRGSVKRLLIGTLGLVVISVIVFAVIPEGATLRYRTLVTSDEEANDPNADQADPNSTAGQANIARTSAASRKMLIKEGILLALRHPIFGVGAGQFGGAMAETKIRGIAWFQPHNTYVQLMSELGFPGFILYMWAMIECTRSCYRVYRASRDRKGAVWESRVAYCLFSCFLSLGMMAMFSHLAYSIMGPLLCGLAVVLDRVAGLTIAPALPRLPYAPPGRRAALREAARQLEPRT